MLNKTAIQNLIIVKFLYIMLLTLYSILNSRSLSKQSSNFWNDTFIAMCDYSIRVYSATHNVLTVLLKYVNLFLMTLKNLC